MTKVIINHKTYSVERWFNMVLNWVFTDKHGVKHLVDGEDVGLWADDMGLKYAGIDTAIAYARYWANELEDGTFWWKVVE